MTKRSWTLGRWALLASLVLLLTGCLKLDMQLDVQADDTVDGSVVFAVNKDVLALTGGSFADLIGDQAPFPSDMEGVTSEEYEDGEFVGQQYNFEGVPISEFNSNPADPDGLRITHEGDTFVVQGALDLSQDLGGLSGATGATGPFDPEQMMGSAQLRIAISFPGAVTEANGEIDGNTVVWEPKFGERQELQATASAVASGGDNWTLVFILLGVAVVAIIAAIIVLMNRRKKAAEGAAATVAEPTPMGTSGAEATAPVPPASMPPMTAEVPPTTAPPPLTEPVTPPPPPQAEPTMPTPEPPMPEPTMPTSEPTMPEPTVPPSETGAPETEPEEEPPPAP
jgi:hypothetical protein